MWRLVVGGMIAIGLSAWFTVLPAFSEKRGIKIDGKDPAEYVAMQYGKSYAVVIGIDKYQKVDGLKYAVADAKAMANVFKKHDFDVTTIYDQQATYQNILTELGTRLVNRVSENDRVVIYFAGHGETHKARGGREMGYLLPVAGEFNNLAGTAINMSMIRDLADALPAKQVLFLVDVCYGGIAGQMRSPGKMTVDENYVRMVTRERGRQLITAGGKGQQALEDPGWGHSVFTYYLLEGLGNGLADLDGDGIIPASELHIYLKKRVYEAARLKNHEQIPEMWKLIADSGEFVFFTGPKTVMTKSISDQSYPDILEQEHQRLQFSLG
ncbi:MAG: caspase family protein, partial [Nitrososphaera sp.]|nr:caspase family protein [Nitrososphaera sp.]